MKLLSKKHTLKTFKTGPKQNEAVYTFLRSLKVGDSAKIDFEDWVGKTPLSHSIRNKGLFKGKYSCRILEDHSGWLVVRIT